MEDGLLLWYKRQKCVIMASNKMESVWTLWIGFIMRIFEDKALMITLILLVVLVVLLFANVGSSDESIIGRWIAPLQQKLYAFANNVGQAFRMAAEPNALAEENLRLRENVAELTAELREMEELKKENERLTELLNVKGSLGSYDYLTARVIGKAPGSWFAEFTVNVGEEDGIREGMIVITEDGLVGKITAVHSTYSKVMSIIEITSGVPAMLERSRDTCVVKGRASELGDTDTLLDLEYLPVAADVMPGDKVITSRHGGVFPKGLIIGNVAEVSADMSDVRIVSGVDFAHLEEVTIITTVFEEVD